MKVSLLKGAVQNAPHPHRGVHLTHDLHFMRRNPNVQQFLKDPANIPQLSAALRGLGRAVSSHGHPNRESLLAVQSRLLALIPQLATGNRMLDDSGRRSSDDSGSDSDIGHDGDGMA